MRGWWVGSTHYTRGNMYRYTVVYALKDSGEIIPPGKGWRFVSCALDSDSDKLVIVWQRDPMALDWARNWERTDATIQVTGQEPV